MIFPPFILGLALGAGAVALFHKRKEIACALHKDNLQETLSKTKEFASDVKDNLASKAKATFCKDKTEEHSDCGCENPSKES